MNRLARLSTSWKLRLKHAATRHCQSSEPNIFILSTARSGTTWLAEMLATQGRFKIVNEPFNLRVPVNAETLARFGIRTWEDVFRPEARSGLKRYLQMFIDDEDRDVRYPRETPFSEFWHWRTDRVLFKILFAGEDDFDWYRRELNGSVVYLLRHPVPVALSREEFPRVRSFLAQPYASNLDQHQLNRAEHIVEHGDRFTLAILDWCLQNAPPLHLRHAATVIVSYEQLVLEPEVVTAVLASRLRLPEPQRMLDRIYLASRSTGKSAEANRQRLLDPDAMRSNRAWLVDRWQRTASEKQLQTVQDLLDLFRIDFYSAHHSLPAEHYLLRVQHDEPASASALPGIHP